MKVKYVVLIIALVIFSIILSSCSLTTHEKGTEKEQVKERDNFGCFTSCSIFSEQMGTEMCEDWKAGKAVQWPPDCSLLSKYPNCVKLCESEKSNIPSVEKESAEKLAEELAAHQMPQLLNIEFKSGVDASDEAEMRKGFKIMDFYLSKWFDRSLNRKSSITVENKDEDNKWVDEGERMAFYYHTLNEEWTGIKEFKMMDLRRRAAAHEYVHLYQENLGCARPGREGEKALWFLEGTAEWLSYKAFEESGNLPSSFSHLSKEQYFLTLLKQFKTEPGPLKDQEESGYGKGVTLGRDPGVYANHALAIEFLMKVRDMKTLDAFCNNLGKGQEISVAFQNAFGTPLEKFYEDFESYYQKIQSSGTSSGQSYSTQGQAQGQIPPEYQEYCTQFASLPSCSAVGEQGSQNYNFCKQCFPDK